MAPIRPLPPGAAARTLAHRIAAKLAPKVLQLNTNFGLRPYRVFLVWSTWTGDESGEGYETIISRMELLPTPKVNLGVRFAGSNIGRLESGGVSVTEVSVTYTSDQLIGLAVPEHRENKGEPTDFYYEIVEDDRDGVPQHTRPKYRISNVPMRDAERGMWMITLDRATEDNNPDGSSPFARKPPGARPRNEE